MYIHKDPRDDKSYGAYNDVSVCPLCTWSGIYGVGKAAEHPPALVVLSHKPDGATQTIAWVGKGIVYDTGGLSIKGKVCIPKCCCHGHVFGKITPIMI